MKADRTLVDGIRQRATLEALKRIVGNRRIGIVFVHTPADLALEVLFRTVLRMELASMADFLRVRSAPVEAEVESLITMADAVLYNLDWATSVPRNDLCSDGT